VAARSNKMAVAPIVVQKEMTALFMILTEVQSALTSLARKINPVVTRLGSRRTRVSAIICVLMPMAPAVPPVFTTLLEAHDCLVIDLFTRGHCQF